LHAVHSVGVVSLHSLDTYSPAGHERLHVCHVWSSEVLPVHGLSVKTGPEALDGLWVHAWQCVVSASVSPLQRAPAMYSPGLHEMRQLAHWRSNCVMPLQKPLMYWPGGSAAKDRHLPLHFAHVLSPLVVESHSDWMYCPSSLRE
jgi:hypothetical protein